MRLRVPAAINQFTHTLDRNQASTLFRLLMKYRPEDRKTKQIRLQQEAELREKGMEVTNQCQSYLQSCQLLTETIHVNQEQHYTPL